MATNLLVPGTLATRLVDSNQQVVYNVVELNLPFMSPSSVLGRPPEEWVDLLSMEHTPGQLAPTRTSLEDGTEVTAGRVIELPYQRLADRIGFDFFRYDWRADLRWNAGNLLDHMAARPGAGPWNLVGHSQGGILIALASKLEPARFAQLVDKVVLVGAPLAGTVESARALIWGRDSLGDRAKARAMARSWPSLYQMLPSWPCVREIVADNGGSALGAPLPNDQQLLSDTGWIGHGGGVPSEMLDRVRDTVPLLADPMSEIGNRMGADKALLFHGAGFETYDGLGSDGSNFRLHNLGAVDGDSLVPDQRTVDFVGPQFAARCFRLNNVPKHKTLLDSEEIITLIADFLR